MTATNQADGRRTTLDWRACKGHAHVIAGTRRKCRHCGRPTWLKNCDGQAAHKVCEEAWINGDEEGR